MFHPLLYAIYAQPLPFAGWQLGYGGSWSGRNFQNNAFAQYYTRAMQFLYYYDYLLTLPDEVPFILHRACNPFTAAQINYAWKGRKTWSEFIDPHGANRADRTSLLDLHTRELVASAQDRLRPLRRIDILRLFIRLGYSLVRAPLLLSL